MLRIRDRQVARRFTRLECVDYLDIGLGPLVGICLLFTDY